MGAKRAAGENRLIRAVLDTNVLVSVALPGSRLRAVAEGWRRRRFRWLISTEIFDEYLRVLTYPKFALSTEEIRSLMENDVLPYAERIEVRSRIQAIPEDPSDNKFLACAIDGNADWIVTGDRHLLQLQRFRGVRIGSAQEFLVSLRR